MSKILGPAEVPFPFVWPFSRVEVKPTWAEEWIFEPTLEAVSWSIASAGEGVGSAKFRYRYGDIMRQWDDEYNVYSSVNYIGWWVRISLIAEEGIQPIWTGRIMDEKRRIFGSDDEKAGLQHLIAYEGSVLLRKKWISRSRWNIAGEKKTLGVIPPVNQRDVLNRLTGNRAATPRKNEEHYLYGGLDLWSHEEYVLYVLAEFMDQSDIGGPEWRLGGQVELLKAPANMIEFSDTQSAFEVLRMLIPPRHGIDFKVVPFDEDDHTGFELFVFALQSEEYSFGNKDITTTLPRNPNELRVQVSKTKDTIRASVVKSGNTQFDKLRIVGEPILMVATIRGSQAPRSSDEEGTLEPKWDTVTLQSEYDLGTNSPSDPAEEHDFERQRERYRNVYTLYGATAGFSAPAPELLASGSPVMPIRAQDDQNSYRKTLAQLPFIENKDYETDPETDENQTDYEPEQMKAAAWVYHERDAKYVLATKQEMHLRVLDNEWGFRLGLKHNHIMALNHWAGANDTHVNPKFAHEKLVFTFAFRAPQRLVVEHELTNAEDSVFELYVPGAELWYAPPFTVFGTDSEGKLVEAGEAGRILRNDSVALHGIMAGLIARYHYERVRARVTVKGFREWGNLLGYILTTVEEDGDLHTVKAPITYIQWSNLETIIKTGYAG